MPVPHGGANLA